MPKLKNTTNYSQAQIIRNLKTKMDRKLELVNDIKKGKAASKKTNSTSAINKKTTRSKSSKTTAQLRAIYAKKK